MIVGEMMYFDDIFLLLLFAVFFQKFGCVEGLIMMVTKFKNLKFYSQFHVKILTRLDASIKTLITEN